nr:TolC family protein [Acinetobacter pittii]
MASYAEEAAKSKVNSVYLDVLDQIRTSREQIENKQRQMQVLANRQATTVRTRELYQEQYKLGTRSLVDLLNAEQAIHSANSELETARYDIYSSIVQYIAATGRSRQAYDLNNISIQGFEVQP